MPLQTRSSTVHAISGNTKSATAKTSQTRRSHTKSRNGCTECKSRHVRCDERKPSCANCEAAERICIFPPPKVSKQKQRQRQQKWHQYHPKRDQRRLEATVAASPCSETSSHINVNNVDSTGANMDSDEMPYPAFKQRHSVIAYTPDQLSHRSATRYGTPPVTGDDIIPRQDSPPASSLQSDDPCARAADCCPGLSGAADCMSTAIFTPQHMILLRNASTVPNFHVSNGNAIDIALRHAVDSPYLIDEVLAFTAFYMTDSYPGSAVYLQQLAKELQTRALASFNRLTRTISYDEKTTAVPRFLYSAILGRHMLAETLAHYRSDFHSFIDHFVECLVLNRGVRVVTPPARSFLYDSEVHPFLRVFIDAERKVKSPGNECDTLSCLMDDSGLTEASSEACRQAIAVLQRSFDISHVLHEEDYPSCASIFLVGVESGFIDTLRRYQPEALIILAHYGVLLHRCRSFWAYGDNGGPLIRAIARHVGRYWQEALAWPLHVLETEPSRSSLESAHGRY